VEATSALLSGLASAAGGYTLVPRETMLAKGSDVQFEFTINGSNSKPVDVYNKSHEKELHLIVVRRDLQQFQHVHPARMADGTWQVALDLALAGAYRVFADFEPAALGRQLTLGTDVFVAGDFAPVPLASPAASTRVDGYEVALDGSPVVGRQTELTFTVTKNGRNVEDLQPYLGAFGHLVSLRAGDLAYLHTHPAEEAHEAERGGPEVRFGTEFPTPGSYRLFLDFQVDGAVRTAAFTVAVPEAASDATSSPAPTDDEPSASHGH
jgi:hypothetical protein